MVGNLAGKTVVITGASSGIGQAAAEAFARAGASLVLASRGLTALETVAARCRSLGARNAIAVATDVTDAEAVRALAARALAADGRIDVWVSNVGVGAVGRFHETPVSSHEQVIRTNLIGHINDAHAVLPVFLRQGRGIFINMISLGAFAATPFAAAYGASKYGLRALSEALRAELIGHPHIHICDVYPAFIDTPGISHAANYVGRALSAPPPLYDARLVARTVVALAMRPRPMAVVGTMAQVVRFAHFIAPQLAANLTAFFMLIYFHRARRVLPSDGNLFAPPVKAGSIDGGLRTGRLAYSLAAASLIALGGVAALMLAQNRRSGRAR
jgi:short-subunit dehydrogenase